MRLFKENKLFKWYLERKGFLTQEECDKIISEIKSQGTLKLKGNLVLIIKREIQLKNKFKKANLSFIS